MFPSSFCIQSSMDVNFFVPTHTLTHTMIFLHVETDGKKDSWRLISLLNVVQDFFSYHFQQLHFIQIESLILLTHSTVFQLIIHRVLTQFWGCHLIPILWSLLKTSTTSGKRRRKKKWIHITFIDAHNEVIPKSKQKRKKKSLCKLIKQICVKYKLSCVNCECVYKLIIGQLDVNSLKCDEN